MGNASITVERVRSISGYSALFRVMLDGRQLTLVPHGQARTVLTTAGDHELHLRIRRSKSSRTLAVHLVDGQEARVRCGRPKTVFGGLLNLLRFKGFEQETTVPIEILDAV